MSALALLAGALLISPADALPPALAPPVTVDGPSPAIVALDGLSVARDGSGAIVYLKRGAGATHVFVSRLQDGTWQAPHRIDTGMSADSSQPVVAAGRHGQVLVAFVNGGRLYVVRRAGTPSRWVGPVLLASGAMNPSLQMTNFGKAYLAFTAIDGRGYDVRAAYYYNGRWALERSPLNAAARDDAGIADGRPQVAAAGDGVAIVVWGEHGHVFSRRVWATRPSVVLEQADVPSVSGWKEEASGEPAVAAGGDSSYAVVAFQEALKSPDGRSTQSRVLSRRLRGSRYEAAAAADGLSTPGTESAGQPAVLMGEYGVGFVTSARASSGRVYAMRLRTNGAAGNVLEIDQQQNASPPDAVPGGAGLFSNLIAWQRDPGSRGMPEISVRYARRLSKPGRALVVSTPTMGPTDAATGLAAAGDLNGNAVVAWVQGGGDRLRIVARSLYGRGRLARRTREGFAPDGETGAGLPSDAEAGSLPAQTAPGPTHPGSGGTGLLDYAAEPPTRGALYRDGPTGRYLLEGTWLFRPDRADVGFTERWWRDVPATSGWTSVKVPNAYNAGDFSRQSQSGYVGWYRRDFTLPQGAFARWVPPADRQWIIRFESVNYRARVWLNGRLLGVHVGAYLPFELDLKGLRAGVNRLVVRVDDRRTHLDLPHLPGAGWWNFGGILREVYLRAVQSADMARVQIRPLLPCPKCPATIDEAVLVRNVTARPQTVGLEGTYGSATVSFGRATILPGAMWTARASIRIDHPRLWSPEDPFLYPATLDLFDAEGRRLGGYFSYSGIRRIEVTPGGRLELNGRLLNLRGVDLHEQDPMLGAALDPSQLRRLVAWTRELGATLIRSHYPLDPVIEELADRYGILIWSEIPVWRVASVYLARRAVLDKAYAMLEQSILVNQNHPSVLLWSIGNELATPVDGPERRYIAAATALVHRLDPTRPVGMALGAWPGVRCQRAYAPLQVLGYNDYFGWFDAGGGSTDDRDALSPFLDQLRACYRTKAILITEFGVEGSRHGPVEERGTYEFQSDAAAFHLHVFATKRWLSGAIYWLLQDFAAYPGATGGNPWPDPPFIQKGLIGLHGRRKPVFDVVRLIYRSTVQIAHRG